MSSNLAVALPVRAPREQPTRQIEIVSSSAQRRARPKIVYAMVAVGGIFAIFMAQLLLSIALSDGAYQISSLQTSQVKLGRVQSALGEQLGTASSTQNLAANAQNLGMVSTSSPVFLRLSDGRIIGTPAKATTGGVATGMSLVPNSLLKGVALISPPATDSTASTSDSSTPAEGDGSFTGGASTGDQNTSTGDTQTPAGSTGGSQLPSPDTH